MTITEVPARAELVGRARDVVDLIRKHALWQEEHRVLHDEVLRAIHDAGLLKLRVPARYGGYEVDARTVCEVMAELARGDGSVGWTIATLTLCAWQIGMLPDEVQDEVFADPDVRVCGTVSPTGIAVPTDGGVILNGEWRFNTGVRQCQWDVHSALLATDDGGYVPASVAVPVRDMTIVDDWYTAGLRATGSVSVVAKDLFVPEAQVMPLLPLLIQGQHRSERNADSIVWKYPFVSFSAAVASAPALGMARAAREAFLERLPNRKITYTHYERQIEAPLTHLQVAEAAVKADEAEFHLFRAADRLDTKVAAGETWTMEERAVARMDSGAACQRAKEAVDVLNTASGGSSLYSDVPIQRIARDIQALNLNGIMHPSTNAETYGRVLCGLAPNTDLL
ncbi:acyl-CoA dehydrogenase family protein [Phytohabitans kaempferiae]|uniref:Acyl-CoA dehydrogenase family protein n=1 Tax=Phytohabitans kaempferiae TaxID=1620943 RepID=A0ABV6M573_9ACTN